MTDFNEATWLRSSFCASGACLEASRAGRLVLVRDSKQPEPSAGGLIQQWARDEWVDLLHAVKLGAHHVAIDVLGAEHVHVKFGLHRHEPLYFDRVEWNAFIRGVDLGEFKYELLPTYASTLSSPAPSGGYDAGLAQVGPGANRPDQVVTGAGAIAVPPVPVTADRQIATIKAHFTRRIDTLKARAERAERILAAQPTYILGRDAIVDMVERFGEARFDRNADRAGDLLDAIRGALTPIPNVEPEPAWGSGPLVEHVPETPVPTTPGTGSADPLDVPCWICLGAPLFRKSEMAAHLRTHEGNGIGLR